MSPHAYCDCGAVRTYHDACNHVTKQNNFSTWEGFGKLWEWAQKQKWWDDFWWSPNGIGDGTQEDIYFVHPDRFADAVYEYLQEVK